MKHYKELFLEQSSEEWLLARRCHITATDSSKLLNENPYTTAHDCYLEKIEGKTTPLNAAMKRGQDLEVKAREFLSMSTGLELNPKVFESTLYNFMMASLDATSNDNSVGFEIKCPMEKNMAKALAGNYDKYYEWQCQKQMLVMGWDSMTLFYYKDDYTNISFEIKRDDKKIKDIISTELLFWENHILTMTPPPLSDRDFKPFDDETINNLASHWIELNELEKKTNNLKKEAEAQLEEITGKVNCVFPKVGLKKSIVNRKGSINWEVLCEEYLIFEEDKEKHRKKGSSYSKFTIEKP